MASAKTRAVGDNEMAGFLVPFIFIISIWYMIEANGLLRAMRHSPEGKNFNPSFFSSSGRWYLIKIIFGLEKIPTSLIEDGRDRLLRVRISFVLSIFVFVLFLYLVKDAR